MKNDQKSCTHKQLQSSSPSSSASSKLYYIDRATGQVKEEKIFGGQWLSLLYGGSLGFSLIRECICRIPLFSWFYGWLQTRQKSRAKILPFIEEYQIDQSEFADPIDSFASFNDFFIRKLRKDVRLLPPIDENCPCMILPADGRYLVYPHIETATPFVVKKHPFILKSFLQDDALAKQYEHGSIAIARLAPVDYHRFHFPCDALAQEPYLIKGRLYSVNPLALQTRYAIFHENKRIITVMHTKHFGQMLYVEVGATNVGSITHTSQSNRCYAMGDEKGFFSFGGSSIVLLFEPGVIAFEADLIAASKEGLEVFGKMGGLLGRRLISK